MWRGRFDQLYIGGEWVEPAASDRISVVSPSSEQVVASVPSGSLADIDRAVAAARDAFDAGPWPRMTLEERIAVLGRLAGLLGQHEEEMAQLCTEEMGCPITQSRNIQAQRPRMLLEAAIAQARSYPFEELRESANGRALVRRQPAGVVAAIIPWNTPHLITMMKLPYGLLAGCTFVVKPSPETPLDSYLLAELVDQAGFPPGVINFVPAERGSSEYLVVHPGVDKVSFTGSVLAGRRVAALCGDLIRRVTLELGGKSAAIVLDDADVTSVVASLRMSSFMNTGQVCSSKTRLVVPRRLVSTFEEAVAGLLQELPVGDPFDPATHFGPLATRTHRDRVEGFIETGRAEGARVVVGGERPTGLETGWYVAPTVFSGVDPDMTIAQEEIFGPVLSILAYDSEDDAVSIANNSRYGLSGQIYTGDPQHAVEVSRRIRTGMVEINASPAGVNAPQGGFKTSGIGRELGPEGFEAFVEVQSVGLPHDLAVDL